MPWSAGNWYESRLGGAEELTYEQQMANKHRRGGEEALQTSCPKTSNCWPSTEGPRLQRMPEQNTFRTQAVDYPESENQPHIAANTMSSCRTTNQDMQARAYEVQSKSAHDTCVFL